MNEVYKTNFSLQQKVFATNLSQNLLSQQSEEQNITNQVWCQTFINYTMLFGEPKAVNMIFKTTLITDVTNFVVPLCNSFTHIRQVLLSLMMQIRFQKKKCLHAYLINSMTSM